MVKRTNLRNIRSKSKNKTKLKTPTLTKTNNKKKTKTSTSSLTKQKSSNFDGTRFVDHKAEMLFNKYFKKKAVLAERVVALDELRHTSIPSALRARDWEPLLNPVSPPSKLLVREFYANIHAIDKPSSSFTIYLRGHYLRVTPTLISNLYGLRPVPDPTFPYANDAAPSMDAMTTLLFRHPVPYLGKALNTTNFTVENHVLTRIVCTNLYPVSHMTFLSLERVRFLYALLSGTSIDIASHICDYMLEVYENASSNQSLPFPCLVNRLVTSSCLPSIDGEAAIDLHGSIGLHSISLSEAQLRKRKSASASAEVPSSSQAQMSSENTQRAENPPSSTSVPLSDTPSPNTLHKLKRIQEHLGITTAEPFATPPELAVAFAPPPDTSAPR
ncbi:hypothetical protein CJ030_MR3G015729 [Morella rubra]|uniref:Putative plant transposon protein domain-containing protein n=1 Tax=Morella rubra TaxID=262757 RepID=A0A6A1W835_9ROSI|nr:hypothetical protein CJ030_MR3G015729 [Morella rubra]